MRAVVLRTGDKPPSKPIMDEAALRKSMASRLRPFTPPFTLHPWGRPEGPPRGRGEAVARAFKSATHAGTGYVVAVLNEAGKGILVRVVDVVVPASVTDANEKVDRWFVGLRDEFSPGLLNLGCTVCKFVGTTSTPSQHNHGRRSRRSTRRNEGSARPTSVTVATPGTWLTSPGVAP